MKKERKWEYPEENPYGSFSVLVRKVGDNDVTPVILESFTNCNLNPNIWLIL